MRLKTLLTAAMLAFVAVSLAVAVADVAGLRRPPAGPAPPGEGPPGDRLIVYYFHTATRCPTCRTIEAHARAAVAPQAEAGDLDWLVLNYQEPAHRHFAREFDLLCPSVVLVQSRAGQVVRWKNLERVWDLTDDRAAFIDHVRAELAAFKEARP